MNLKETCDHFLSLCDAEWNASVSASALSTLNERKWNTPHRLPLTEDIRRVTEHLKEQRSVCLANLKKEPSSVSWLALARVCLATIILFNRRRSGEASKMLIKNYQLASSNPTANDDALAALSVLEKKLIHRFVRVEVKGKRGRKVPVLLTATMCEKITLNATRDQVGVSMANEFVFARPNFQSEDHLAGHKALRMAAKDGGAVQPENITGTSLRKHLATVCQILNLTEHELEQVATYMGHNIAVHRDFYRLPEDTYQLAKVSKLLLRMEKGGLAKFHGKSLEDIEIEDEFSESELEAEEEEGTPTEEEEGTPAEKEQTPGKSRGALVLEKGPIPGGNTADRSLQSQSEVSNSEISTPSGRQSATKTRDFLSKAHISRIQRYFRSNIDSGHLPGKPKCTEFLASCEELQDKPWQKIKSTVRNEVEKRKRQIAKLQQ